MTNAAIITTVLRYAYNVDFDEFKTTLGKVINSGFVSDSYAQEKFDKMRNDFVYWFCNLDDEAQERFVDCAFEHYGICKEKH